MDYKLPELVCLLPARDQRSSDRPPLRLSLPPPPFTLHNHFPRLSFSLSSSLASALHFTLPSPYTLNFYIPHLILSLCASFTILSHFPLPPPHPFTLHFLHLSHSIYTSSPPHPFTLHFLHLTLSLYTSLASISQFSLPLPYPLRQPLVFSLASTSIPPTL